MVGPVEKPPTIQSLATFGPVSVRWTKRDDGDFSETSPPEWTRLKQVHGGTVVVENEAGECNGREADAIVTQNPESILSIRTADCLSVAFIGDNGIFGAAHAGWKGLAAGVIENTVEEMRKLGAKEVTAASGPCIGPECYEFEASNLNELATKYGGDIIAETSWQTPALNLHKLFLSSVLRAEIQIVHEEMACTACNKDDYFSARARNETERMAMVVWNEERRT